MVDGGWGNDVVNAGAGADTVIARGGEVGSDRYDGEAGTDTLRVELTSAQYTPAVQQELAAFKVFAANPANQGATYTFATPALAGLKVSNFESLVVRVNGADVVLDTTAAQASLTMGIGNAVASMTATINGQTTTVDSTGTATKVFATHSGEDYNGTEQVDYVRYEQQQNSSADINLSNSNDKIYFGEHANGKTLTGDGNDVVIANQGIGSTADIKLGDGNDVLVSNEHVSGTIRAENGNDLLVTKQMFTGNVDAGEGNDVLISGEHFAGSINMGRGDDFAQTGQSVIGHIYGGEGTDTIKFGDVNAKANWESLKTFVHGFEKVIFADGSVYALEANGDLGSLTTSSASVTAQFGYRYPIALSATLGDTDGSETLSNIRLSGLPTGVTVLDAAGNVLAANNSGVFSIPVTSGTQVSLTLVSATVLAASQLGVVTASVTSTESGGGASTTTTATYSTPLILDLDGNGVTTVDVASGVQFDINGDGTLDNVGWVGGNDAFLVRDLNQDGQVNNGSELFGGATKRADGSTATDGFAALADLDANNDGLIDSTDSVFDELKLWRDANHDGKVDEGEMMSLKEAGVASMNLAAQETLENNNGNLVGLESSYTTVTGQKHEMSDVWLAQSDAKTSGQQLLGTDGNDVFQWSNLDKGTAGAPNVDTVLNFGEGDQLDVSELLVGEKKGEADDVGNLLDFLHVEQDGDTAVIHISSTGGFVGGFEAGKEDQTIKLENYTLTGSSEHDMIQNLINSQKLITD